jgi:hypothetical protein
MTTTPLHILFSASGAGALRQALAGSKRAEEVICLHDNLSFGPIDTLDPAARMKWLAAACRLRDDDWSWLPDDTLMFWSRALSSTDRPIVWFTRNSAKEFAGFLAYLDQVGQQRFTVVDGANLKVPVRQETGLHDESVLSFGELRVDQMRALLDTDQPLAAQQVTTFRDRWAALRGDAALLRVVTGSELTSAPIDFFDEALLSSCTSDWQRAIRVIATAMLSTISGQLHQVDEMLLCSRILALLERGLLEIRENATERPGDQLMREAHIRLPGKSSMDWRKEIS